MTDYVSDQIHERLLPEQEDDNGDEQDRLNGYGNGFVFDDGVLTEHCHSELLNGTTDTRSEKVLMAVAVLSALFIVAEFTGGFIAHSLAIMTDAGHMLSDLLSFIISIIAIRTARSPANQRHSFGYQRAEILGATLSIVIIWVLTTILVMLAIQRIISKDYDIDVDTMLITASVGVLFNLVMGAVLHIGHSHGHSHGGSHGHSHGAGTNVNVRAALVHVLGDFVQSIGVLVAAVIIKFTGYQVADPICTFLFSVVVLVTSITVMRDIYLVLMEATPRHIDYSELRNDLLSVTNVKTVHSLHVWSLNMENTALSVHLAIEDAKLAIETMKAASQILKTKHAIKMTTVQVEPYESIMSSCEHCRPL
uniref:Zinc transporter 2 n=1 Tax=Steinernema glaseri TaxID=37863 RepID=A0A1I7Y1M1_9BILA